MYLINKYNMTSANNSFTNWYIQNIIHNLVYFTNNAIKTKSKQKFDVFCYHYLLFIVGINKNKYI